MNISFDFDKTLSIPDIQETAKSKIDEGNTVWIITRRYLDENKEVEEVANKLGIPLDRVIYTNGEWKWRTIKDLPIDIHYDDKLIEVTLIERYTKTKCILV